MRGGTGYGVGIKPLGVVPLASYGIGMGKGLKEPCSPYREAYVFGAELNVPNASGWNCLPEVVDATKLFNLASIPPYQEVVVAILYVTNLYSGLSVRHKWYRGRDGKLLFAWASTIPDPGIYGYSYWAWYYVYSYIGYVPWEIWEDGYYHVDLTAGRFSRRLNFSVTGVVGFEPPPEVPVTLQAGEAKTVPFEAIPWEARTYQVSVNGLTGSFAARYK